MTSWGFAAIGGYKERIEEAGHPAVEEEVQWDVLLSFVALFHSTMFTISTCDLNIYFPFANYPGRPGPARPSE